LYLFDRAHVLLIVLLPSPLCLPRQRKTLFFPPSPLWDRWAQIAFSPFPSPLPLTRKSATDFVPFFSFSLKRYLAKPHFSSLRYTSFFPFSSFRALLQTGRKVCLPSFPLSFCLLYSKRMLTPSMGILGIFLRFFFLRASSPFLPPSLLPSVIDQKIIFPL